MTVSSMPWLSFLIFFPLVAAALVAMMPRGAERSARLWATLAESGRKTSRPGGERCGLAPKSIENRVARMRAMA